MISVPQVFFLFSFFVSFCLCLSLSLSLSLSLFLSLSLSRSLALALCLCLPVCLSLDLSVVLSRSLLFSFSLLSQVQFTNKCEIRQHTTPTVAQCFSVFRSVSQCFGVFCSGWQCCAVFCSVWRFAVLCSVLQCLAVFCSVVQHYSTLPHSAHTHTLANLVYAAARCSNNNSTRCTPNSCRALVNTATHCNMLQHTLSHKSDPRSRDMSVFLSDSVFQIFFFSSKIDRKRERGQREIARLNKSE